MLLATSTVAIEREPRDAFEQRRRALAERCDDGLILLFGFRDEEGQSGRDGFRQENNFYYLTGWNEPGAALLLTPASGEKEYREILFLPGRDPAHERWDGPRLDPGDPAARALTGVAEVAPMDELAEEVSRNLSRFGKAWALSAHSQHGEMQPLQPDPAERLDPLLGTAQRGDVRPILGAMRRVKSPGEVALLEKAVAATAEAHLAAWRVVRPGLAEYQVYAAMAPVLLERGCLRPAYPPILGSGPNSVILHYTRNTRILEDGDLLLADVGGEYGHYAADITRTIPVNGRFSKRQREIYDLVLAAQDAVVAAVKPGMRLTGGGPQSLSRIAEEVFRKKSPRLAAQFPHAVGHYVGLDVHDPGTLREPLEEGMVITVEPGLYLADEGLGVRIEDMLVVTADGARRLGPRMPREADEIEAFLLGRERPKP